MWPRNMYIKISIFYAAFEGYKKRMNMTDYNQGLHVRPSSFFLKAYSSITDLIWWHVITVLLCYSLHINGPDCLYSVA